MMDFTNRFLRYRLPGPPPTSLYLVTTFSPGYRTPHPRAEARAAAFTGCAHDGFHQPFPATSA
jgi:hypothetical protein